MAKPNALKELESQYGNLEEIIPKLVNLGGQKYAAHQLNTSQSTISKFLKEKGYIQKVEWVKVSNLEAVS